MDVNGLGVEIGIEFALLERAKRDFEGSRRESGVLKRGGLSDILSFSMDVVPIISHSSLYLLRLSCSTITLTIQSSGRHGVL